MQICTDSGFTLSGTQYGNECFCGEDGVDYLQHGESDECDFECEGDPSAICGGYWSMSVRRMLE